MARGTTLFRYNCTRYNYTLSALISEGNRKQLLSILFCCSLLGSEGNFGGLPRQWFAASDHRSLNALTHVLASSRPVSVLFIECAVYMITKYVYHNDNVFVCTQVQYHRYCISCNRRLLYAITPTVVVQLLPRERWRNASKSTMLPATAALSDSASPRIGMLISLVA